MLSSIILNDWINACGYNPFLYISFFRSPSKLIQLFSFLSILSFMSVVKLSLAPHRVNSHSWLLPGQTGLIWCQIENRSCCNVSPLKNQRGSKTFIWALSCSSLALLITGLMVPLLTTAHINPEKKVSFEMTNCSDHLSLRRLFPAYLCCTMNGCSVHGYEMVWELLVFDAEKTGLQCLKISASCSN